MNVCTNNGNFCQKVQFLGAKRLSYNTKGFSTTPKSTTEKKFCKNTKNLTPELLYNQIKVEWYYFPSLHRYLKYYNVAYTAKVSGLWYILTVDYSDLDFALHFYMHVKGGAK